MSVRMVALVMVVGFFGLLLGGCSSTPRMGQYDIEIALDAAMASGPVPSLTVDIVGASDAGAGTLRSYDVTRWFSGNDAMRNDAKKTTVNFSSADTSPKLVLKRDKETAELWKQWRDMKATSLFVLVNLPQPQAQRRLEIPLATHRWKGENTRIKIEVRQSGLEFVTGPLPPPAN